MGGSSRGRDICKHTDDSLCYTADTNTIVKQLYPIFFLKLTDWTIILLSVQTHNFIRPGKAFVCRCRVLLMKVKEESEKVGLKLNIRKTKIMASSSITSWQIDGETVETVADFILRGSKITADGDCSHEIKRHLLGRKVMTNLDRLLKSRDISLPTKVCLVKAMVFPVVMYGCKSWTLKKAEHWRVDAFELWCWRRLLRVPWTARRSNQSILK